MGKAAYRCVSILRSTYAWFTDLSFMRIHAVLLTNHYVMAKVGRQPITDISFLDFRTGEEKRNGAVIFTKTRQMWDQEGLRLPRFRSFEHWSDIPFCSYLLKIWPRNAEVLKKLSQYRFHRTGTFFLQCVFSGEPDRVAAQALRRGEDIAGKIR